MKENKIIKKIFNITKTIAVVGLSPDSSRPSHYVSKYLKSKGFKIIPVYPKTDLNILEEKVYQNLIDIKEQVQTVLIFRKPEYILPYIYDAIKINARAVWLQEGIINNDAKRIAEENELLYIMDRCMYKEHSRLFCL